MRTEIPTKTRGRRTPPKAASSTSLHSAWTARGFRTVLTVADGRGNEAEHVMTDRDVLLLVKALMGYVVIK